MLQAAKVDEETLLKFSRDDLQDLFFGPENFLLRRRLWTIIEKSRNTCDLEVEEVLMRSQASVMPHLKVSSTPGKSPSPQIPLSPDRIFFPISKICSPQVSSSPTPSSIPSTPSSRSSSPMVLTYPNTPETGNAPDDMDVVKSQPSPAFVVYCDSELSYAVKNCSMSDALFSRLIRSQLSNMRSELHRLPIPREPSNSELEDMARALCRKYPCLRKTQVRGENGEKTFSQVSEEETQHFTEHQRNDLHLFVLSRLKKRMYNSRPPKRPQGKVPARGIKRLKKDIPEPVNVSDAEEIEPNHKESAPIPHDISERHYSALDKELKKKKPNKAVVNQYLNLDFKERRKFVEETPKALRPAKVLERYPCFKDVTEVVEEVRRTLDQPDEEDERVYQRKCEQRFINQLDVLIYYGIAKGVLKPPRGQSTDTKVLLLMKGMNMLFKSRTKASKSKVDVIHLVEEGDTAPATWLQKKGSDSPGLLLTRGNGSMLYLGNELLARFEDGETAKAVVSFLASFYLLDLDYPPTWLLSLSVLQKLVFEDKSVHPDCQADVVKAFQELEQYCFE